MDELVATSADEVVSVVRQAREAQRAWSAMPIDERISQLRKAKRRFLSDAVALSQLLEDECGYLRTEALTSEVVPSARLFDFWTDSIRELLGVEVLELDAFRDSRKTATAERTAIGVVGVISPSARPLAIPLRAIVPALLAGNSVVFKPSESASGASARLSKVFDHLPAGVFSLVSGGPSIGERLIEAGIDHLVFAGRSEAGRAVLRGCADQLTPATVDLAGTGSAIVVRGAKLDRAAREIVWAAFSAASRHSPLKHVYVEKKIADAFGDKVAQRAKALEIGRDIAPLRTADEGEGANAEVRRATDAGATILAGGICESDDLRSALPTIVRLEGDLPEGEVSSHRVLTMVVVDDVQGAIARVQQATRSRTTSIWAGSMRDAEKIAEQLSGVSITVNCHGNTDVIAEAPRAGSPGRGFGVTSGLGAFAQFTRPRVVVENHSLFVDPNAFPHTKTLEKSALAFARLSGGASFPGRVVALFSFVAAFVARLFGK